MFVVIFDPKMHADLNFESTLNRVLATTTINI